MDIASPALRLALYLVLLSLPGLASAQKPDVGPGRTAVDNFIAAFNDVNNNTKRLLNDPSVTNGPCQEIVRSIASRDERMMNAVQQLATEMSALIRQVEPIIDVQAEVRKSQEELNKAQGELGKAQAEYTQVMGQVTASQQSLDAIRQNQKDAIRDWLLDGYGEQQGPPMVYKTEKETVVVCNTLFGAIVVSAPRQLATPQESQTTVQFTPALFTNDLFPDSIQLGPVGTSIDVPKGFEFAPQTVSLDTGSKPFDMTEATLVPVDGKTPIIWNWKSNATEDFHGAKFDIRMGARHEAAMGGDRATRELKLPIEVQHDPGKPWLERFSFLITPFITGLIGLGTGVLITRYSKGIDRTDKQKERDEAQRQVAEAERKKREEEDQKNRKRLHLPD